MKRIAIIGIVGLPPRYGGFETFVDNLIKYIRYDFEITVYCSSKNYEKKTYNYNGIHLKYLNISANGIQSIFYDSLSIISAINRYDKLLILGLAGAILFPFIKLFTKSEIIVNCDGIEWKRKKWNILAKIYFRISEFIVAKFADKIIADNKGIKEYYDRKYGVRSIYIPYGADHVNKRSLSETTIKKYPFLKSRKYALSVMRIEPENNVEMILNAFKGISNINLVIIGNWNRSKYGRKIRRIYNNYENIYLIDEIYEKNELDEIRSNCYIYVHGHTVGGTNPSLIEAMYLGLPIIAYDCVFNRETTKGKALYFKSEIEIKKIINSIDNQFLLKIKKYMLKIANEEYLWKEVSKKYKKILNE